MRETSWKTVKNNSSDTPLVEDLARYIEYRLEDGETVLDLSPGKGAQLRAWLQGRAPAGSDPLKDVAVSAAACNQCRLGAARTRSVPGQGNPHPEIMFIGEAPGEDEDLQGLAFVGAAGQLLTRMIVAMGLSREQVFIANICKCRPPGNRPPEPDEMAACLPFLRAQIAALRPRVIVALGGTALFGLLQVKGITRARGTWMKYEEIDLMPTFHPSYLLRTPGAKREVWADLQEVLKRLGRTPPPARKAAPSPALRQNKMLPKGRNL